MLTVWILGVEIVGRIPFFLPNEVGVILSSVYFRFTLILIATGFLGYHFYRKLL